VATISSAAAAEMCGHNVATIVGTESSDVIVGTPGPDVILAKGGDDEIN
jgi:hypothetical protein